MFDGGDACLRRIEPPRLRDRVGRHPKPGLGGFVDDELQVVDGVYIPLVVDDDLDPVGSEVDVFSDGLPDLVTRVGVDIILFADIPEFRVNDDLPRERRDDLPRNEHFGAGKEPVIDRPFQIDIGVVPGVPHVADRREPGLEHGAGVGCAQKGPIARCLADHIYKDIRPQFLKGVPADGNGGAHVRMAVEKTGQHRRPGKIDDPGILGDAHVRTDGLDRRAFDDDDLVGGRGARHGIDQPAGFDDDGLRLGPGGQRKNEEYERSR